MELSFSRPLFHPSNDVVLVACGSIIQCISVKTGESLFSIKGNTTRVNICCFDKKNANVLLSGCQDGQIIFWNYLKQEKIDSFQLQEPVYDIIVPSVDKSELILVLGKNIENNMEGKHESSERKRMHLENVFFTI